MPSMLTDRCRHTMHYPHRVREMVDTHSCGMCSPPDYTTPDETIIPLNNQELHLLCTAPGRIYTSTDGSVKQAQTLEASSTWTLSIRISPTMTISRRGKINLSHGEESSYRVELEGLVELYIIFPADITTRNVCDNERRRSRHTKTYTTMRENRPKNGRKLSTKPHSTDSIRKCSVEAVTPSTWYTHTLSLGT
jgi:hypothetical protein